MINEKKIKLPSVLFQPSTTPFPTNLVTDSNMPSPSTTLSQSATEVLEQARGIDAMIRTGLGTGGDIIATVKGLGRNLVSNNSISHLNRN